MQNFIAQSLRRAGVAPKNTVTPTSPQTGKSNPPGNDPLGHMNIEGKYSYSTLSYPLDLQTRSDLGYYIMFYVNVPMNTEYSVYSTHKAGTKEAIDAANKTRKNPAAEEVRTGKVRDRKDKAGEFSANGKSWKPGHTDKVVPQRAHKGNLPRLTKRTTDAVVLYMPNSGITSQHTPQWSPSEMGADVGEAASRVAAGGAFSTWKGISGFAGQIATKMRNLGIDMAGAAMEGFQEFMVKPDREAKIRARLEIERERIHGPL